MMKFCEIMWFTWQESENGHWHIPVASEHDSEGERTWLCVTRANSQMAKQSSSPRTKGNS